MKIIPVGVANGTSAKTGKPMCHVFGILTEFDSYLQETCECAGQACVDLYVSNMNFDFDMIKNKVCKVEYDIGFGGKAIVVDLIVVDDVEENVPYNKNDNKGVK